MSNCISHKKILLLIVTILLALNLQGQDNRGYITVSGNVKFVPSKEHREKYPFLLKGSPGRDAHVLDTIQVDQDGNYSVKVSADPPGFYSLDVFRWDRITFWAGKDNLTINFRGEDTAKVKIKNPPYVLIEDSGENQVVNMVNFVTYQTYQNVIYAGKLQYLAMQQNDSLWKKKATDLMMHQYEIASEYTKKIIQIYRDDPTVLYALYRISWRKDSDLLLSTLDHLILQYPWLHQARETKAEILDKIAQAKKIAPGQQAPPFSLPGLKGNTISLKDFKGKYLIIDFWASWCGPCRKENPHVKKVYKKYKPQGLEVLSVSIDTKEDAWRDAVEKDGLFWTQVIAKDSKPLMKEYQFSGIPFMVLLDKEGKIIAKNLRGDTLDKQLAELFE